MANPLTSDKINRIAQEYIRQAYNRTKTLQALGYSKTYSDNAGLKLFDNVRVIAEVRRLQAELGAKIEYNKSKAEQMLMDLLDRCKAANDRTTEATVLREMNTINALRVDVVNTNDTTQAKAIDDQAMLEAKRMAEIRLKQG